MDPLKKSLDPDDEDILDVYLQMYLAHSGLATNVLTRSSNHWGYYGSDSPLFGLASATIHYHFGDAFSVEDHTYQMFKTTRVEDIGLDEMTTAILVSAYPWDCGLSYTWAGVSTGNPASRSDPAFLDGIQDNAESIQRSGFLDLNIQDTKQKLDRVRRLHDFKKSRNTCMINLTRLLKRSSQRLTTSTRRQKRSLLN